MILTAAHTPKDRPALNTKKSRGLVFALLCILLPACTSIGPDTIPRDRFDYASAITQSWKSQMLRNIVLLHYGEPPVFLEVASIINQYEFSGKVSAGATAAGSVTGGDIYNLNVNSGFIDRPTITDAPLTGKLFAQNLLTPIPPESLFRLIQAGYPADFIFDLGARAINGVRNRSNIGFLHQEADPEFENLLQAIRNIQKTDASDFRIIQSKENAAAILFIPGHKRDTNTDIADARRILGLSNDIQEYELAFGLLPQKPNEIAILSRSMLEILLELSAEVETPEAHVKDGSAPETAREIEHHRLRIHSQPEPPADAFTAIRYRDHWFGIDNSDRQSKRALTFLMVLFSLAETGSAAQVPVVTVGAGS